MQKKYRESLNKSDNVDKIDNLNQKSNKESNSDEKTKEMAKIEIIDDAIKGEDSKSDMNANLCCQQNLELFKDTNIKENQNKQK